MKRQFYILTIIFFALAIFNAPTAKADGTSDWSSGDNDHNNSDNDHNNRDNDHSDNDHSDNDHNNKGDKHDKDDTNLPINNGVLFLTVAGMGIGVIMIRKNKAVKAVVKG